jgi:hypothetical protein
LGKNILEVSKKSPTQRDDDGFQCSGGSIAFSEKSVGTNIGGAFSVTAGDWSGAAGGDVSIASGSSSTSSGGRLALALGELRKLHQRIKRCCKNTEKIMLVPGMAHDGQDGRGVYQNARFANIVALIKLINPIFSKLQKGFPSMKKTFLDAGCGSHLPGVQFAIKGGYLSIGFEIDTARCAMAANFLQNMLEDYPLLKVALFNKDITIPGNWSEVAVFYYWDRVSDSNSSKCINTFTFMIQNTITSRYGARVGGSKSNTVNVILRLCLYHILHTMSS